MDIEAGELLVRLARRAIEHRLSTGRMIKPPETGRAELMEKRGVFVTLSTYPEKRLRGCIGFPEPVKPLLKALIEAAIAAATEDPRFQPLRYEELDKITVEVTVLSPPELVEAREKLKAIEIGRDGLIIEKGFHRGLLLPQVPVEQGWSAEEFLAGLCMKAGLPPYAWMEEDARIYRFQGVIFSEREPGGRVERRLLEPQQG